MIYLLNACLMLDHRPRRWPNIKQALGKYIMSVMRIYPVIPGLHVLNPRHIHKSMDFSCENLLLTRKGVPELRGPALGCMSAMKLKYISSTFIHSTTIGGSGQHQFDTCQ